MKPTWEKAAKVGFDGQRKQKKKKVREKGEKSEAYNLTNDWLQIFFFQILIYYLIKLALASSHALHACDEAFFFII